MNKTVRDCLVSVALCLVIGWSAYLVCEVIEADDPGVAIILVPGPAPVATDDVRYGESAEQAAERYARNTAEAEAYFAEKLKATMAETHRVVSAYEAEKAAYAKAWRNADRAYCLRAAVDRKADTDIALGRIQDWGNVRDYPLCKVAN